MCCREGREVILAKSVENAHLIPFKENKAMSDLGMRLLATMLKLVQRLFRAQRNTFVKGEGFCSKDIYNINIGYGVKDIRGEDCGFKVIVRDEEDMYIGYMYTNGKFGVENGYKREFVDSVEVLFGDESHNLSV